MTISLLSVHVQISYLADQIMMVGDGKPRLWAGVKVQRRSTCRSTSGIGVCTALKCVQCRSTYGVEVRTALKYDKEVSERSVKLLMVTGSTF